MRKGTLTSGILGTLFAALVLFCSTDAAFSDLSHKLSHAQAVPEEEKNYEIVNYFADLGIITGNESGDYQLDKVITRYEYATIIHRYLAVFFATNTGLINNISVWDRCRTMVDMPADHWAQEAVCHLIKLGLVEGYCGPSFKGYRPLSKYEYGILLGRLLEIFGKMKGIEKDHNYKENELFQKAMDLDSYPKERGGSYKGDRALTRYEFLERLYYLNSYVKESLGMALVLDVE